MKKILVVVAALVGLAVAGAPARATVQAQNSATVAKSSSTCVPVAVSTPGASVGLTEFTGANAPAGGWAFVQIRNLEASNGVWVNDSVNVSTTSGVYYLGAAVATTGVRGDKVAAGKTEPYVLTPGQKWYGVCDKTSGTCDVQVCKHD
jgi:hypothetical protein